MFFQEKELDEEFPNVIVINTDDLGCYGATKVQTPNIDKMAAEEANFH